MRCDEVRSLLGICSVGGLSRRVRGRIEAHIRDCAGCREELARLDRLDRVLSGVGHEAPPSLWPGIAARLAHRRATPWLPLVAPTAVAAAVGAALVIAVFGRQPTGDESASAPPAVVVQAPGTGAGRATNEDPEIPLWYARASLGTVGGDTLASTVILQRAAEVRSE